MPLSAFGGRPGFATRNRTPNKAVATTIAMNTKTLVKIVGAIAMLLGSAISISAVMAYWELKSLERSGKPRSEDSLPLTKFVGPELLDTRYAGLKPSILAKAIYRRIYVMGGSALVLAILGACMLAAPPLRGRGQ